MKQTNRLFNERPSAVLNIGNDIQNAARHRNDTYETPEELRAKAFKKSSSKSLKALKTRASAVMTEANFLETINRYELDKFLASSEKLSAFSIDETKSETETINLLYSFVVALRGTIPSTEFNTLARSFNRMTKKRRENTYRLSWSRAQSYFNTKAKESFVEKNGSIGDWKSEQKTLSPEQIERLKSLVSAVQFGNSVPDSERVYCSLNLLASLETLSSVMTIDATALGFSFGARGNGKSVAFYQDSAKVLSFNRHVDGAFLHELGHAVDYRLGKVSSTLPREIRQSYREKLSTLKGLSHSARSYYLKETEIFARLFEQFIAKRLGDRCTEFMFSENDPAVMPELNEQSQQWIESALSSILKGAL
jgi:hypothetical protein